MTAIPIICIGSALWDVIASASANMRPGYDIAGTIQRRPGGVALNIAVALAAQGVRPELLSTIGDDADGDTLIAGLTENGVSCTHVLRTAYPTDCYLAIELPGGDVFGAIADCAGLERAGDSVLAPATQGALSPFAGEAVVDGNLPTEVLARLHDMLPLAKLTLVPASPGKADRLRAPIIRGHAAICINLGEAETLCQSKFADSAIAAKALIQMGASRALVTNSAKPASLATAGHCITLAPPPVVPISTTGAGDVVLAAYLAERQRHAAPDTPDAMHTQLTAALTAAAAHITKAPK